MSNQSATEQKFANKSHLQATRGGDVGKGCELHKLQFSPKSSDCDVKSRLGIPSFGNPALRRYSSTDAFLASCLLSPFPYLLSHPEKMGVLSMAGKGVWWIFFSYIAFSGRCLLLEQTDMSGGVATALSCLPTASVHNIFSGTLRSGMRRCQD
eukprot:3605449-Rhodomonas_salina.3